jgi:subtilisin family serine protease
MWPPKKRSEREPTKLSVQTGLIENAMREKGIDVAAAHCDDGTLDFLYQRGVILVRDAYLSQVRNVVGGGDVEEGFTDGVTLYRLQHARISEVADAVQAIDSELGAGVATPSHILSIAPVWSCPATEPQEVPAGILPDPGVQAGGDGAFIYVPDTGLLRSASSHPWLAGVTGQWDELPPPGKNGADIPPYAGHGTFIAGVARCMAPVCSVRVTRDFDAAGALSEHELVRRLDSALSEGADIISLSACGTTRGDRPLLGFETFWDRYRHYKGVVMLAAAGNNSSRRPVWPAAFPQVVSVGSLAANGRDRAYFSDFGPWVDVYAPGEGLVNAFASGNYVCREPPDVGQRRVFHGMARWSGTSFSTPLVAGLVAARMSRTGENGRRAADALLATARAQRIPGVGPALWPGDTGTPDQDALRRDWSGSQSLTVLFRVRRVTYRTGRGSRSVSPQRSGRPGPDVPCGPLSGGRAAHGRTHRWTTAPTSPERWSPRPVATRPPGSCSSGSSAGWSGRSPARTG